MKELSRSARSRLDRYLSTLRRALSGVESVDPWEVEQDVLDHVERELETCREPIGARELAVVLEGLGSPMQWLPGETGRAGASRVAVVAPRRGELRLAFAALARAVTATVLGAALLVLPWWALHAGCGEVLRLEGLHAGRFPARMVDVAVRVVAVRDTLPDFGLAAVRAVRAGPWIPGVVGTWWSLLGLALWTGRQPLCAILGLARRRQWRTAGTVLLLGGGSFVFAAALLGFAKVVAKHGVF